MLDYLLSSAGPGRGAFHESCESLAGEFGCDDRRLVVRRAGQETTTYSYDGLGRLKGSTISGGTNSGRTTGTCFDAAGNRTRYDVATSAPGACPTPTPTPT